MDVENKKATRLSYGEALVELGKENDNIVVFDCDVSRCSVPCFLYHEVFQEF